jgi:hypothetical protein
VDADVRLALSELESQGRRRDGTEIGELIGVVASSLRRPSSPPSSSPATTSSWRVLGAGGEIDVDGGRLLLKCPPRRPRAARPCATASRPRRRRSRQAGRQHARPPFVRVRTSSSSRATAGRSPASTPAARARAPFRARLPRPPAAAHERATSSLGRRQRDLAALSRLNFVEAFAELAELHPADIADVVGQVGRASARPCSARSTPTWPPTRCRRWMRTLRAAAPRGDAVASGRQVLGSSTPTWPPTSSPTCPEDLAEDSCAPCDGARARPALASRAPRDTAGG